MAWPTTSRQSRGYGADHDRMRKTLMREVVLCEVCKREGRTRLGTIADHVVPKAKGGTDARSNYQLLCRPCSDAKTLADSGRQAGPQGSDANGWPVDPMHPWNRRA